MYSSITALGGRTWNSTGAPVFEILLILVTTIKTMQGAVTNWLLILQSLGEQFAASCPLSAYIFLVNVIFLEQLLCSEWATVPRLPSCCCKPSCPTGPFDSLNCKLYDSLRFPLANRRSAGWVGEGNCTNCGVFKVIEAVVSQDEPASLPGLHPSSWKQERESVLILHLCLLWSLNILYLHVLG